jgi:ABC-2 type transport system permease protein
MLRRERVISVIWILSLVIFSAVMVPGLNEIIGDEAEREALVATLVNPSIIAMMGPLYEAETAGGLYAFMLLLWTMIAVGLMNIFLIVRHTRADEERSRAEVIRSLPVGRVAALNAALITALIVNSVLALLTGLCMGAIGVEGMGMGSCMLYGTLLGTFGLFCAALTAVFSQLCVSSRGALGLSGVVMIALYMVRAMGDMPNADGVMENEILSLISPMGLLQRSQVFVKDIWVPVFTVLLITAAAAFVAFALNRVRDMDQGFIPARPGRREAKKALLSPIGLSWRLVRNVSLAWVGGMFLLGAAYGSIMGSVADFIESNEFYAGLMIIAPDLPLDKIFAATINIMLSICSVIPVLTVALKLRGEEKDGRIEHVLARAVSRTGYLAGYVTIGLILSIVSPLAAAVGLYASASAVMEQPIELTFFAGAALVYLPALWVMLGLAVLLVGLLPKAAAVCWAFLGYSIFSLFFGRVLDMPEWMVKITPFGYIPVRPVDDINWLTMFALTALAAGLTAVGFVSYRKRDMHTT